MKIILLFILPILMASCTSTQDASSMASENKIKSDDNRKINNAISEAANNTLDKIEEEDNVQTPEWMKKSIQEFKEEK